MNIALKYNKEQIWEMIRYIPDPEIPVITIEELGVLRDVEFTDDKILIVITPTYSGCPAMKRFEDDVLEILRNNGITNAEIKTIYSPAWTTDWITDEALKKLEAYGIAPPVKGSADKGVLFASGPKVVRCPQCKSEDTKLVSQFGSTACKAQYQCNTCLEPFDYFKCI
jgi:ring-1,2-phenylacetyl-CoA epoxidase subunit PaaD